MIRVGDVLHACVFAVCVGGGAFVSLALHRVAMLGVGYGLVAWVVLILGYLATRRLMAPGYATAHESPPAPAAGVPEEDESAFEVEDGKND